MPKLRPHFLLPILLMATGAAAQEPNLGSVMVDQENVLKMLNEAGSEAKLNTRKDGDPWLDVDSKGLHWRLYFVQCLGQSRCLSMTMEADFAAPGPDPSALANKWNSLSRFSRVFVNADATVAIAADVALAHAQGEYVQDALSRWIDGMQRFHTFLQPKSVRHADSEKIGPAAPNTSDGQSRGG